jgi:K+-transporting ATPase ATPase C chain
VKTWKTAAAVLLFWTLILGGLYPLLVTGFAAVAFPGKSGGSLIYRAGTVVGSRLLAQSFTSSAYFHPRPSAADYATIPSGASNLGSTSAALGLLIRQRSRDWEMANETTEVPAEMVTASASGLDPDIGPEAALLQVPRVAAARALTEQQTAALLQLVRSLQEGPELGFLGEPRVNVLELNLALDQRFPR